MPDTKTADRPAVARLDRQAHPALVCMNEALRVRHRFAADIVDRSVALFGTRWADEFESVVGALFPTADAVAGAVRGYAAFAMQSMRLQAAFEVEGQYRPKTYDEAASEVYFNEQHMMQEYLPGLLLSHFLWPHHYRQLQFFDSAFVDAMRVAGASSFVEVGIGTGLYSGFLLRRLPDVRGTGFDISPFSKQFTEAHLDALGVGDRYEVELRDVTVEPIDPRADWLVCVEVLEHLEDPVAFLRGLRATMAPGGKAFITAALNAAHADHIHLYRAPDDVLAQLVEAGFTLEQSFVGAAYRPSAPGVPVPLAAAFVVC
ncbi:class I SAM-dependent methyltransferase [Modestobacter sp. VKM Ac-2985]|uniref:class I SAM-dependent methyltransferase n=1 Tax=Modestobacter sp. VKM Ac-2985 TaxID=3004139 RepID=UPI0022ABA87D|nr:class I SAM-dependent methyltransferase [Modestobacter sp. VKM Ac-2985]MCZ2836533.1 class I SAM-dependent methyltransferase [Modestobacter sp. VKM Ac-2985]